MTTPDEEKRQTLMRHWLQHRGWTYSKKDKLWHHPALAFGWPKQDALKLLHEAEVVGDIGAQLLLTR